MEGLELSELALLPALTQALMSCRWVQLGDQTQEADLGELIPVIPLDGTPWVGGCLQGFKTPIFLRIEVFLSRKL